MRLRGRLRLRLRLRRRRRRMLRRRLRLRRMGYALKLACSTKMVVQMGMASTTAHTLPPTHSPLARKSVHSHPNHSLVIMMVAGPPLDRISPQPRRASDASRQRGQLRSRCLLSTSGAATKSTRAKDSSTSVMASGAPT